MRLSALDKLQCPYSMQPLQVMPGATVDGDILLEGILANLDGQYRYEVKGGIPDLLDRSLLEGDAADAHRYYSTTAGVYDDYLPIAFELFFAEESDVRSQLTDHLRLRTGQKVLDLTAGTGKDAVLIAEKLGEGEVWLNDLTRSMLEIASQRVHPGSVRYEFSVADACALPFRNGIFDSVYSFTGLGSFRDPAGGLSEMARVARTGGRVVVCEKSVPPWLRQSEFGRVLIEANPMFAKVIPLAHIPVSARNVEVRWIMNEAFYVIAFDVGEGEPTTNLDLELPGPRGGTFGTRYYGRLEGVTQETKRLALQARERSGKSMHKWLDEVVRKAAVQELGK